VVAGHDDDREAELAKACEDVRDQLRRDAAVVEQIPGHDHAIYGVFPAELQDLFKATEGVGGVDVAA